MLITTHHGPLRSYNKHLKNTYTILPQQVYPCPRARKESLTFEWYCVLTTVLGALRALFYVILPSGPVS